MRWARVCQHYAGALLEMVHNVGYLSYMRPNYPPLTGAQHPRHPEELCKTTVTFLCVWNRQKENESSLKVQVPSAFLSE